MLPATMGMVGSAMVRQLAKLDCDILTATRAQLDLRDRGAVMNWYTQNTPDIVVLAAAKVGGILANDTQPALFLQDNLAIQNNTIEAAHRHNVQKLLFLGSSCVYPKLAPQPIAESSLLTRPA